MAKSCPQCKKEIPSSASFCSFCGTQQVENENLSEEEKLRKELSEMQETIRLLKKALMDAQQNSDSSEEKQQTIEKLQKELTKAQEIEKKTVAKTNTYTPPPIVALPSSPSKPTGLIVALIAVIVIAAIIIVVWIKRENNIIRSELEGTKQTLTEQQIANENFKREQMEKGLVNIDNNSASYLDYSQTSKRLLTENDLLGLSKNDLRILRNEIYARHGYIFKSKELIDYFSTKSWYTPLYNDVENVSNKFSSIERQNVKFIKNHE